MSWDEINQLWTTHPYGSAFEPWAGVPEVMDCLYFGHSSAMWDKLKLTIGTGAYNITEGVWEWYSGNYDQGAPSAVVVDSGFLTFSVNNIFGSLTRAGTVVRVKCLLTGVYQDSLLVYREGVTNKVDTSTTDPNVGGLLGQTTPSTNPADYTIGSIWREVSDLTDETSVYHDMLSATGSKTVSFTLPQSTTQKWEKIAVGAAGAQETGYWLRFRVSNWSNGATSPIINAADIASGDTYAYALVTQGESKNDDPLGSTTGEASFTLSLLSHPVIDDDNIKLFITEGGLETEWSRVDNFINSLASDRHFVVSFNDDGWGFVTTGDGVTGKIPDPGINNVRATYRTMADTNGNLGANQIVVNNSGLAMVKSVYNPRAAAGYAVAEGSTPEDLARVKVAGPASLRVQGRGVTVSDVQNLTENYTTIDGSRPFERSLCVEGGLGSKTVTAVVVGTGGRAVEQDTLDDLEDYFNGNDALGIDGVLLLNTRLTAANFTPHPVDVTVTVTGGTDIIVRNALTSLLTPNVTKTDGTFEWEFGGLVPRSKIISAIMNSSVDISNVSLTVPASDIDLDDDELPTAGTLSITIA
jgi:hypothetical protein